MGRGRGDVKGGEIFLLFLNRLIGWHRICIEEGRGKGRDLSHKKCLMGLPSPTVVDLFCGAGLLSYGFCSAGFRPVFAIDSNEDSIASYRKNVGDAACVGDVRNIPPGLRCEVIVAGPPCQGFSILGLRDSQDTRNNLCLVVPLWAQETRCKVVVVENVPQFVKSFQHEAMVKKLRNQGFAIESWMLNAADFGTPQNRKRSFTIASKIGLPEMPLKNDIKVTVREAFKSLPSNDSDPMCSFPTPSSLAMARFKNTPLGGGKDDIMKNAPDICLDSWFERRGQTTDVWGRILWEKPSNTIRCYFQNPTTGRYIHPEKDRVITLREGARLQDIPDSWIFQGKRTSVVKQIGNGVPIKLGRIIGKNLHSIFNNYKQNKKIIS